MSSYGVIASSPEPRAAAPVTPTTVDSWVLPTLLGLSLIAVMPIWQSRHLPFQDLGLHLVKVDLLLRYLSGDPQTLELYQINWSPFPDWFCFPVLAAMAAVSSIDLATRLYVSALVIGMPLAAYVWMRRANPRGLLFVLAVPALAHNLFLAKGNLNFCTGLVLYPLALLAWENRRFLAFTLVATTIYLTHGIVFFALVGTVAIRLILDYQPGRLRWLAGLLPGLICFAIAVFLNRSTNRQAFPWPLLEVPTPKIVLSIIPWLFGPEMSSWLALAWGLALGLGVLLALTALRDHAATERPRLFWLTLAAAFGTAFIICTTQIGEWSHFRQRFLPLCVFAVLGVVLTPSQRGVRWALGVLFAVTSMAATQRAGQLYVQGNQQVEEYLQAARAIEPAAAWLPLDYPSDDWVRPALHAWGLHQMQQPAGWTPYIDLSMVAQARMIYPVLYRVRPWSPPQSGADLDTATMQRVADCYDYILVWNPTGASQTAIAPFFEPAQRSKHIQVWRNRQGVRAATPERVAACRLDAVG